MKAISKISSSISFLGIIAIFLGVSSAQAAISTDKPHTQGGVPGIRLCNNSGWLGGESTDPCTECTFFPHWKWYPAMIGMDNEHGRAMKEWVYTHPFNPNCPKKQTASGAAPQSAPIYEQQLPPPPAPRYEPYPETADERKQREEDCQIIYRYGGDSTYTQFYYAMQRRGMYSCTSNPAPPPPTGAVVRPVSR